MTHEEYKQQLTAWAGLTEKRLAALCDEYLPQQSELGGPRATAFWAAANGCAPC